MDNMFSGMGLGDYVNKDNSKLVSSMINGPEKSSSPSGSKVSIPSASKSSNLSLQEKRQIMEQQEAAKSQVSVKPTNLTDTLIAKSLSMSQMPSTNTWSAQPAAWSSLSPPSQQMQGATFGNFARPAAQKPDLSAFDNLLSPTSGSGFQNKQPMNSIGGKVEDQMFATLLILCFCI